MRNGNEKHGGEKNIEIIIYIIYINNIYNIKFSFQEKLNTQMSKVNN